MTDKLDPNTHRLVQTKDGVVSVPREQKGVPIKEYFRNVDMPQDLSRAVVFATSNGPVLTDPDPVPWNEQHNEKAKHYAGRIQSLIDEKGYYSKVLNNYAGSLANETGQQREDVKALIIQHFKDETKQDPYQYLQKHLEQTGKLDRRPSQNRSNGQAWEQ